MKRLKLNIPPLIVILAISLTITANADILKDKLMAPEDFCYTTVGAKLTCPVSQVVLSTLNCTASMQYSNKPIYSLGSSGRFSTTEIAVNCTANQTFCCAEIVRAPQICSLQPQLTIDGITAYYKITAIHCKSINF